MDLSKTYSNKIYFENKDYLKRIAEQIQRDFDMSGVLLNGSIDKLNNYGDLYTLLLENISELIHSNSIQFKNILYRIDVSELTIHKSMGLKVDAVLEEEVTKLIIDRCLQKVLTKEKYSSK